MASLARDLLDLLLPSVCLDCGDRCTGDLPLCATCLGRLAPVDSGAAALNLKPADGPTALWMLDQEGPARSVIHALKYGGLRQIGPVLGRRLARRVNRNGLGPFDAVLPIPLHRTRLRERGYNQAALLAQGMAAELKIALLDAPLVRTVPGPSQTRAGRTDRARAVHGAFRVRDPGPIAGQSILLVDDVVTTGSTVRAAAGVLSDAGASRIHLAVVGLTRPEVSGNP